MSLRSYMTEEFELMGLSVGLILTNGVEFLGVRPTGQTFYDLPKGMRDEGENLKDTVLREVKEETGLNLYKYRAALSDQGRFHYRINKDVHVFILLLPELPSVSEMKCVSTFELYGRRIPEVNGYKYFSFDDLSAFIPKMQRIIREATKVLK